MNIIETKLKFLPLDKRTKTDLIILHHAVFNGTVEQIHNMHLNKGWSGIGYHFYVRKDGKIYRGRPEDMIGAHAYGFNTTSIGICFEGNFEKDIMSDKQTEAGQDLVDFLKNKYKVGKVIGHKDVNKTACPGKNFPFDKITKPIVEKPKGEFNVAKTYKNGRTKENVFADTSLKFKTGSLNAREICECLDIVKGKYLVKYKVDDKDEFKTGFVKYRWRCQMRYIVKKVVNGYEFTHIEEKETLDGAKVEVIKGRNTLQEDKIKKAIEELQEQINEHKEHLKEEELQKVLADYVENLTTDLEVKENQIKNLNEFLEEINKIK